MSKEVLVNTARVATVTWVGTNGIPRVTKSEGPVIATIAGTGDGIMTITGLGNFPILTIEVKDGHAQMSLTPPDGQLVAIGVGDEKLDDGNPPTLKSNKKIAFGMEHRHVPEKCAGNILNWAD